MKNRKMTRFIALLLIMILLPCSLSVNAKKTNKIKLDNKNITLKVGSKTKVTAYAKGKVKWKSSNKNVASVSAKGVIKGLKSGKAKVTASNKSSKAMCKVTVVKKSSGKVGVTDSENNKKLNGAADSGNNNHLNGASDSGNNNKLNGAADLGSGNSGNATDPSDDPGATANPPMISFPPTAKQAVYVDLNDESCMVIDEGVSVTHNDNDTLTIVFDKQYDRVSFFLPKEAREFYKEYKYVTLEYVSNGYNLGNALYSGYWPYEQGVQADSDYGMYPNFDEKIVAAPYGYEVTFEAGEDFTDNCIRGLQIFNPAETGLRTEITVKSVMFSKNPPFSYYKDLYGDGYGESDNREIMPGEVLVTFYNEYPIESIQELIPDFEIEKIEDIYRGLYEYLKDDDQVSEENLKKLEEKLGKHYQVTLVSKKDEDVYKAIAEFKKFPGVKYAEPNQILYPDDV